MSVWVIIGLIGIVSIITRSYLLEGVRNSIPWPKVRYWANCPQCMGTWVGILYCIFVYLPSLNTFASWYSPLVDIVIWGGGISLLSSAVVTGLDCLSFYKSAIINQITADMGDAVVEKEEVEEK